MVLLEVSPTPPPPIPLRKLNNLIILSNESAFQEFFFYTEIVHDQLSLTISFALCI